MSFDRDQFELLIREALTATDPRLCSDAAVELLLGTAAQESRFGKYLRQLGGGPARGVFQMEPATFDWLRGVYGDRYGFATRAADEMVFDLRLAALACRLRYRVVPAALPAAGDLPALAEYWKRWYNTRLGAGTIAEFTDNYQRYVV